MQKKLGFTSRDMLIAVLATFIVTLLLIQANVSSKVYAEQYYPTATPTPTPPFYTYLPLVCCACFDRPTPTPIPTPRPTPCTVHWR